MDGVHWTVSMAEQAQGPLQDGQRGGAVPWGHFKKARTLSSGGANHPCPAWGSQQVFLLHSHGTITSFPAAPGLPPVLEELPQHISQSTGKALGRGTSALLSSRDRVRDREWAGGEEQAEPQHVPCVLPAPSAMGFRITRDTGVPSPSTAQEAWGELYTLSLPAWHGAWLLVPAQMPGTWLSQRMLSCEQQALGYFCCAQVLPHVPLSLGCV